MPDDQIQFGRKQRNIEGGTAAHTISISKDLSTQVDAQVDAGVAPSRSAWFERAGWVMLELQKLGEAMSHVEEGDDDA